MSISERAKQFMSFQALRGYEDMVQERTVIKSEKKEITDEQASILSERVKEINKGDMVEITYYEDGSYITFTGMVSNIDLTFKSITVVKKRIEFSSIYNLRKVENDQVDISK